MSELDAICDRVAFALLEVPGIETSDINPPDVIAQWEFPKVLVYPGRSRSRLLTNDDGDGNAVIGKLHTIFADIHVALSNAPLATTVATGRPFIDLSQDALWAAWIRDQFGGSVTLLGDPDEPPATAIRADFAEFGWGSTPTIGVRAEVDVWVAKEIPTA